MYAPVQSVPKVGVSHVRRFLQRERACRHDGGRPSRAAIFGERQQPVRVSVVPFSIGSPTQVLCGHGIFGGTGDVRGMC